MAIFSGQSYPFMLYGAGLMSFNLGWIENHFPLESPALAMVFLFPVLHNEETLHSEETIFLLIMTRI